MGEWLSAIVQVLAALTLGGLVIMGIFEGSDVMLGVVKDTLPSLLKLLK